MDEQRYQQYLTLINSILEADSDEQRQRLAIDNQNLIDEGLIQTMLYLADNDEDENRALHFSLIRKDQYQYSQYYHFQ